MIHHNEPVLAVLTGIAPHVSGDLKKSLDSTIRIFELFPGQSAGQIAASIENWLAGSKTTVPAMIQRARNLVEAAPDAANDSSIGFMKDFGKTTADDKKSIFQGLGLPIPKAAKELTSGIKNWIESKGTELPKDPDAGIREAAAKYAGDFPQRMIHMTPDLADEIERRTQEAFNDKQLGAKGFEMYVSILIGTPVKGTKAKLRQELKGFVDRLVVSYAQSRAI